VAKHTFFIVSGKEVFDVFGKEQQQLLVTDTSCVGQKNELNIGMGPFNQKAWDLGFL
jgi:hypothetical protein